MTAGTHPETVLIEDARTRWDVTNIQSNLAAEISAGHTYTFGGETETVKPVQTGYLGIDWELNNNMYRIKRIIKPAVWDTEIRSPFDHSGVDVDEGDSLVAIDIPAEAASQPPLERQQPDQVDQKRAAQVGHRYPPRAELERAAPRESGRGEFEEHVKEEAALH